MIELIGIWLAGGFAAIGALKGISTVIKEDIAMEVYIKNFVQSWYAFGEILLIMLSEIGNHIAKNKEEDSKK
jgi:hypothetical protein